MWPAEPGICDQMIPRWYYDRFAQECLPFNYTGKCNLFYIIVLQIRKCSREILKILTGTGFVVS